MPFETITLTPAELIAATHVGMLRQYQSLLRGNRDIVNDKGYLTAVNVHILGALGEAAFGKWMNVWWNSSEGTYCNVPDIHGMEIRTRSKHEWDLIIRDGDEPDRYYVHVTGEGPGFRIHGCVQAKDAKIARYRHDYGFKGKPAYFFPASALTPMREWYTARRD